MEFSERVVVVTGAAGEFGQAIAKRFYDEGAILVLTDIDRVGLNRLISEQSFDSERVWSIQVDARDEEQVQSYVQKAVELFGAIDVFVHCVGILGNTGMADQLTPNDLMDVFETNVVTAFINYKYISRVMQRQGKGSVLFMGSFLGKRGSPFYTPYAVASHGLAGLTRTSALDCSQLGVRVNSICPSPVRSKLMSEVEARFLPDNPKAAQNEIENIIPMGRYAKVEEVVELTMFLSSNRAKFITGVNYSLDGGLTAK